MAVVIEQNEVLLNSVRYPLVSKVFKTQSQISMSEQKHWLIKDQTGGIGCMEIKRTRDLTRCWWSTCELDHAGHLIPPPLATAATGAVIMVTPTGFTASTWGNEENAYDDSAATAATSPTFAAGGWEWCEYLTLDIPTTTMAGVYIRFSRSDAAKVSIIDIDYYDGSWHDGIQVDPLTTAMLVGEALTTPSYYFTVAGAAVTQIRVRFYGAFSAFVSVFDIRVKPTTTTGSITSHFDCNFGANCYLAINNCLSKVNTSTGVIDSVAVFATAITSLTAAVGSVMVIGQGDSEAFWYMSIAEVFTQTDALNCKFGINHNNRFYWMNSSGQLYYTATLAASPSVTTDALMSEGSTIQGIDLYQDATGVPAIYCRTNRSVWVHDKASTPTRWLRSNIELAAHATTGKAGLSAEGYYVSQGIHIIKYVTGGYTADIYNNIGLDADDGLPSEYNAHIVAFIRGAQFIYALMDSTKIGTGGYSWIAKYNEIKKVWSVLWATGTVNQAMFGGIVSSVYAQRLWFDCGNVLYYIPLPTTLLFPKLVSGSTYAAAAIHITPWLEGDLATFNKTIASVVSFCKGITTTETVTISYRIDRTNIDVGTGWTPLVVLDTTAENGRVETKLASGAGAAVNTFQIRLDFARGATTTASADVQGIDLSYLDRITVKYVFGLAISTASFYKGLSPRQLEAALKVALESTTLNEFTYRDGTTAAETYYVKVQPDKAESISGREYEGRHELVLLQP